MSSENDFISAAEHLESAASHNIKALEQYQASNYVCSAFHAFTAHGHILLAHEKHENIVKEYSRNHEHYVDEKGSHKI